jgi:hypothetical protein
MRGAGDQEIHVPSLRVRARFPRRSFVVAFGTPSAAGRPSTEQDPTSTESPVGGRGRNSLAVLDLATKGVRSVRSAWLARFMSVVWAADSWEYSLRQLGAPEFRVVSATGANAGWPSVDRDAARRFRLAIVQAEGGTVRHAVADEGDTMLSLAEEIGCTRSTDGAGARRRLWSSWHLFSIDQSSSSAWTREHRGGEPSHPSLFEDVRTGDSPPPRLTIERLSNTESAHEPVVTRRPR